MSDSCLVSENDYHYHSPFFQDWSQYGIECDGTLPQTDPGTAVLIPDMVNPLSDNDFDELQEQVDPLAHDEGYGIDLYVLACTMASRV